MQNLDVIVELSSPLAIDKGYFTLDGILYGILLDMHRAGTSSLDPMENTPILNQSGLFFASGAQFDLPVEQKEIKLGGIRPVKDMDGAISFLSNKRKTMPKVVTSRGNTKAHISRYRSISCRSISWSVVGDADKIKSLLTNAGSIGALRKEGRGQIASVQISDAETDRPRDAVIGPNGVLRPIPVALGNQLELRTNAPTTIDTWKPPYWDQSGKAECFVPL